MFSVRLVIVLVVYGVLVAATLVTITVVFSVLGEKSTDGQVLRLAKASVSGLKQATVDQITSYEMVAFHISVLLTRLNAVPPLGTTGQDINDYIASWDIMTVPEMEANSTFLSTFSMWLDTTTNLWYMTGCNRQTELCSLYDASTNTTQFVAYTRDALTNPVDTSSVHTVAGTPPMYPRYMDSMQYQTDDKADWWGYLYIDNAQSITTHICEGVEVAKTIDYFYCTEYYTPSGSTGAEACSKLVGVTVEASEASAKIQNAYIEASIISLTSTKTVDNVNGICNPDDATQKAIDKFLASCTAEFYSDCTTHLDIGHPYVYTVLGYSQANGVAFVIADRTPHSFFYAAIEKSRNVAIAISVVMIVVIVFLTVVIAMSIVVPISYICASMKNASNLNYERRMAPITRYTIFSEVQQLCASYLDLRQALKDLKAFMPQGLLVGPDEGLDSTSLLSELMGGGRFKSGDPNAISFAHGIDDEDDEESDDDVEMQLAGRAGGYSTPDATSSADPSVQLSEHLRRRSMQTPSVRAPSAVFTQTREGDGNSADDSPLPNQRRRSTAHGAFIGQSGVVSVVPVSTVDEAMARNTALQRKGSSMMSPAVAPVGDEATPPFTPSAGAGGLRSGRVQLPGVDEYPADRHTKTRNGHSTLNAESSRGDGGSLRLNRSVYNGDINKFRNVSCTLLCIRFFYKNIDAHSLGEDVSQLMNILIRVVLRCGGIIEIFRPDLIIASFGAHATMSMHTQRATAAAITLTRKLTVAQRARTRIVVDTGAFYCGTCGASGRVSPVLFGDRFDDAFELLRYDLGQGRLLVTDRVALTLPNDFVVPFDYVVTLRDRSHGSQIYLVLNPAKRNKKEFRDGVSAFRRAYTLASSGNYREAMDIMSRGNQLDPELAAHCVTTYKYLMAMNPPRPRYCRFQLPGFEPLGVTIKEQVARYQHERLRLNDLEVEDEGQISINFGFGGTSSSATAANGTVVGQSQSRLFGDDANGGNPNVSGRVGSYDINVEAKVGGRQTAVSPTQRRRSRAFSHDSGTAVRSFAMADDVVPSGTDQTPPNGSCSRVQTQHNRSGGLSISRAEDTGRSDVSEEGLPLVFSDHKGERWHRFPAMIGSGAFAEVYKALSESGALMALKCIHLAATNVQLADVVMEVNTACKLFSDFIVNHIGWAHVGNYMIIIMDYMSGGSLHSALSAFPTGMTLPVARRYASDALRGLAYLHRNGVVHADFKPQNILLAADGGCRLSDFGSSVTKANARSSGGDVFHLRGTPAYMSPEVARGDPPSTKSDMWSFGITVFEILTGRQPWVMKKNNGLPSAPGASFLTLASDPTTPVGGRGLESPMHVESLTTKPDLALHAVSEVPSTRNGAASLTPSNRASQQTNQFNHSINTSSVVAAPMSPAPSPPAVALGEDWVPVQGLSDVRFVQGIANGSVRVRLSRDDFPSMEAFNLVEACLQESPLRRPVSWEIVDHSFFFSY